MGQGSTLTSSLGSAIPPIFLIPGGNDLSLDRINSYQSALQGHADSLCAAACFQFFQNMRYMDFDCAFCDVQDDPNLLVAFAQHQSAQNFQLASRQLRPGYSLSQFGADSWRNPRSALVYCPNTRDEVGSGRVLQNIALRPRAQSAVNLFFVFEAGENGK